MPMKTDASGPLSSVFQPVLVSSSNTTGRIAIALADGFSMLKLGLVVWVFEKANQVLEARQREATRFRVALFSSQGGIVTSSSGARIETDALDKRRSERFEGIFMLGGDDAAPTSEGAVAAQVLRLVSSAKVMNLNDEGKWLAEAAGQALAALAATGANTEEASFRQCLNASGSNGFLAGHDDDTPFAAALALVRAELSHQTVQRTNRRASPKGSRSPPHGVESDGAAATDPIHAAMRWLRENSHRAISISQVAQVASMSERNFLRRFKLETAMTPSEYLMNARFETSCRLMASTNLPIDKVARRSGLGNGERLCRVFRRRLSTTPTEYRLRHRSKALQG